MLTIVCLYHITCMTICLPYFPSIFLQFVDEENYEGGNGKNYTFSLLLTIIVMHMSNSLEFPDFLLL